VIMGVEWREKGEKRKEFCRDHAHWLVDSRHSFVLGGVIKIGKHNPCLRRGLNGVRRNGFPVFTDPPE